MHKKILLIIAVCIIAVSLISCKVLAPPQISIKHERTIVRNFDNQDEERALSVAESINYSAIFALERFDGSSDPEAYLHTGTYLEYTYANFIDSEVISYYETRYNDLQGKGEPKQIELNYEANVTKRSELRIFNSPAPEGATWHNTTVVISADGLVVLKDPVAIRFFYRNQSGYNMVEWEYDFNFSNCYVVELKLVYSEMYAPLAAFESDIYEIVVLDQNFEPVLIGVESAKIIS